ncbi:ubiquitin carboxyl-terminal hydrolase 31 isoform X2 [Dendroctonus ponderosae]|uniref:ubiquitin carboxyl-terminal hydrolase 31 isoform X2 n=1 Tax=Dendroctonus ponderosae TaxID=77166 RepID=UPI00203542A4|nr:ubiquitin carboxyl-terminal hydrolase 31 isoform X2 [Dendroctonus ponderosae]
MCDLSFAKSSSAGELLNRVEMTFESGAQEPSTLKRTFTLPRNPFNASRMSKKWTRTNENESDIARDIKIVNGDSEKNNKKVFRRPSIKKIISKIAQHISGVPGINQSLDTNRVPPVDFQTWGPEDTPGVTGLKNQGNTCFINAVLQCISHTDILAEYFVLDKYKLDLARRNKLNSKKFGTKGEVTEQLAKILKALWACQYCPELSTSFKQVLEKHGSQYKGNQQHDAQEFLLWLLDKVHEDLNTASKKKYKNIKTSGRPDEVIAAETLENYRRCNNSFIQSIFQAQYRSSLSCSRCRTQSNTFDPFQCISVQLPQFHKQSIYVTVVYTSQQPRQVQIGLNLPSGASINELRAILESDTSIEKSNMLLTEIGDAGFMRTFNDAQCVSIISEIDPVYCVETAQLKDSEGSATSPYILLCWINIVKGNPGYLRKFGSPYTMQVSRETNYDDLQKLVLKEMAPILHDDILISSQPKGIFKMRISDPAWNESEPPCYLEPQLEHPLFMEAIDQALALCSEDGGPPHVKLVMEWTESSKKSIIAEDGDLIEEHSTVKLLRAQALQVVKKGGAPLTLEECLRDYTEAETLSDAWRCPHCQQYQPVVKTLDVWSLPDILIVHFKRFRQHSIRGGNSTKLTTMVDFPVYGFDMSPHLATKRQPPNMASNNMADSDLINGWSPWKRSRKPSTCNENVYDLYAICYHHGTDLETGHYTAACKNPYDLNWYLYDDAKVKNLSKDADDLSPVLVNNSAYILFYQRRSMGISSNSSAASTSSVGSGSDHWVCRMPKFVPPKFAKQPEKVEKTVSIKDDLKAIEKDSELTGNKTDEIVALRNSQNTLYSSRKSLEIKVTEPLRNSPTLSLNLNRSSSEISTKKPIFTTSVYINSPGSDDVSDSPKKLESIKVILREPTRESGTVNVTNDIEKPDVYTTTASIQRHSDIEKGASKTHLNWMSPQPIKKSASTQEHHTVFSV